MLFAPENKRTASVERLHDRAAGRYVPVLPVEMPGLAQAARSAATQTDLAVQTLDHALDQTFQLPISRASERPAANVPEL